MALRCTLQPFAEYDTIEYIKYRLERAGAANQTIFPEDVLAEIHYRAQGIPRIINAVCDNLLLTAFAAESRAVTMEFLDEVCRDLRLDWPARRPFRAGSEFGGGPLRTEPQFLRSK